MITRSVVGFDGLYTVTDLGVVTNVKTGKEIAGTVYSHGYRLMCLSNQGKVTRKLHHAIVAEAFIGPRPAGHHVDHINGIRLDNRASNLRYLTPAENIYATVARGAHAFGSRNGQAKLTEAQVLEIRAMKAHGNRYWGAKELAMKFGVSEGQIRRAARGTTFKHDCAAAIRGNT